MKTLSQVFRDIASAIRSKGIRGAMTPLEMPSKIAAIDTSGTVVEKDMSSGLVDVRFFRPDGQLLYSYSKTEVLSPEWELPIEPAWNIYWETHTGTHEIQMTPQGWNYTKAQIIDTVQQYGVCDIGGLYVPKDGKTHMRIEISEDGRLDQPLRFGQSKAYGVEVDWGDGSPVETFKNTAQTTYYHEYPGAGVYDLTFTVNSGTLNFVGDSTNSIYGVTANSSSNPSGVYRGRFRQVLIGNGVTSIGNYAFKVCHLLEFISIPTSVTSFGSEAVRQCNSMIGCVLPPGIKSLTTNFFYNCFSLQFASIPRGVTSLGSQVFTGCYVLQRLIIPPEVTSIGSYAFSTCYTLAMLKLPTNYGNINNYVFSECYALQGIVLSENATTIGSAVLNTCHMLSVIRIPPGVTSIGSQAFYKCYGTAKYDFSRCTQVPTLANANAFTDLSTSSYIVVPDALYDSWKAAPVWNSSSIVGHIVKASLMEGLTI